MPSNACNIRRFAGLTRQLRAAARWKTEMVDRMVGRPNLLRQYFENTNRDALAGEDLIQADWDSSPLSPALHRPETDRLAAPRQAI